MPPFAFFRSIWPKTIYSISDRAVPTLTDFGKSWQYETEIGKSWQAVTDFSKSWQTETDFGYFWQTETDFG